MGSWTQGGGVGGAKRLGEESVLMIFLFTSWLIEDFDYFYCGLISFYTDIFLNY